MQDDPIREALWDAALGVCSPIGRCRCETPCGECEFQAAAAISAFNKALVSHFHSAGKGDIALDLEALAAAVERAAHE